MADINWELYNDFPSCELRAEFQAAVYDAGLNGWFIDQEFIHALGTGDISISVNEWSCSQTATELRRLITKMDSH